MALSLAALLGLSIFTGLKKKEKQKGINAAVVSGLIMGTLVGGSSTVGTAQLAYNYGMSAWWFTLGGGIACLILALVYVKPMRRNGSATLVGMIGKEYGRTAGLAATILNSLGTFINILSQLIAASAVVLVVWPSAGTAVTIIISAVFMVLYVVFGGTKGAGIVGILKLGLLYVSMVVCGILALQKMGGTGAAGSLMAAFSEETGRNFASVFSRGAGTDLGACVSLILGVLTTQTYAQAVLMARSDAQARTGALISAVMIPPIGIFGILVGLYMRNVTDAAAFPAKTALTGFILNHSGLPGIAAGIILGTLFIASVGTGAGLALGISAMVDRELLRSNPARAPKLSSDKMSKILIVAVLALATALCCTPIGDTILMFAFMSMGLRGCTVFAPLTLLLFAPGRVHGRYACAGIIAGSLVALLWGIINLTGICKMPCDAVFPGVLTGILIMLAGLAAGKKERKI